MALGTLGLLLAVDKRFELVLAFLTDVLEDRHGATPSPIRINLWPVRKFRILLSQILAQILSAQILAGLW
jgi:hypothetical protein